MELAGMDDGVDSADDPVGSLGVVAGEVGELPSTMFTPTALRNPTITAFDTNRSSDPSRKNPAVSITTPVRMDSVYNARAGSEPEWTAGVSSMMMAMAPVACTAMKAEPVKNEPPSVPNTYPYSPDSGLTRRGHQPPGHRGRSDPRAPGPPPRPRAACLGQLATGISRGPFPGDHAHCCYRCPALASAELDAATRTTTTCPRTRLHEADGAGQHHPAGRPAASVGAESTGATSSIRHVRAHAHVLHLLNLALDVKGALRARLAGGLLAAGDTPPAAVLARAARPRTECAHY